MVLLNRVRLLVLALVGVTLPIENRAISIEALGTNISQNKIVTGILVVFVALQWAVTRRAAPVDPKRLWMLFFGVSVGLSAFQAYLVGVPPYSIFDNTLTSSTLILFYFVLSYALTTRRELDLLFGSFVLGCLIALVSGLLGFGVVSESVRYGERLVGEGGNANLLTFNLLIGIALAASFFFTSRRRAVRLIAPCLIVTMAVGIVLSLTRTAYVALPAAILFFALRFRRGSLLKYAVPAAALILLPILFAPERVTQRFVDLTSAESIEDLDASARSRFIMIPQVLEALAENPLTGVGLSGFRFWAGEHGYKELAVHNAYLQVLVEQGLLGFIPFAAILVLSWTQLSRATSLARRFGSGDPELQILAVRSLFLQVAFVALLVMGLAQPSNRHKGLWLLFALSTVAYSFVRNRVSEIEPSRPRLPERWSGPRGSSRSVPLAEGPPG